MAKRKRTSGEGMQALPGFEALAADPEPEAQPQVWEGPPKFFDAARLPDAPGYQPAAQGALTHFMYVLFPDKPTLDRGLAVLSMGARLALAPGKRIATIDALHPGKEGVCLLERWEAVLGRPAPANGNSGGAGAAPRSAMPRRATGSPAAPSGQKGPQKGRKAAPAQSSTPATSPQQPRQRATRGKGGRNAPK